MRIMLSLCALTLTACSGYRLQEAALPSNAEMPMGAGRVCVARAGSAAPAVTVVVRDNDVLVGATRAATSFCYYADPGLHEIRFEADATETTSVTVVPGGRYYLRQDVENAFGYVTARPEWVDEREGLQLLDACAYSVVVEVPDGEVAPPRGARIPGR